MKCIKKEIEYRDRFHKHYELHKEEINKKRKELYNARSLTGICVRCKKKSVKGIKLCKFHRIKQKEYNERSR